MLSTATMTEREKLEMATELQRGVVGSGAVDEWGRFLSGFHWQAFATPTFRKTVTLEHARLATTQWIAALGPEVYAYIAYEQGVAGGRTHCHALIGGMYEGSRERVGLHRGRIAIRHAKRTWRHGNIKIEPYDAKRGAAWYVAKYPDQGEIVGTFKRHRPRRKRTRRLEVHHTE